MSNKTINRHFGNFEIAGFTYWEGCRVFEKQVSVVVFLKEATEAFNKQMKR
jgi:hypothetical protein